MNAKLERVYEALDDWCTRHRIPYDVACDEADLQGFLVFRKHSYAVPRLLEHLKSLLTREGVFHENIKTRSGTVLAFSVRALTEEVRGRFLHDDSPAYIDKIDAALHGAVTAVASRGNLAEDLSGLAAKFQPRDVLARLDQAMKAIGLHAALSEAGIVNRLSEDKQRIIFYIKDANQALRPIATYNLVELGEANNLQDALDHLMDLAQMEAPGTGQQKREVLKQQEQQMREIAKRFAMPSPDQQQGQQQAQSAVMPAAAPPMENWQRRVHAILDGKRI